MQGVEPALVACRSVGVQVGVWLIFSPCAQPGVGPVFPVVSIVKEWMDGWKEGWIYGCALYR